MTELKKLQATVNLMRFEIIGLQAKNKALVQTVMKLSQLVDKPFSKTIIKFYDERFYELIPGRVSFC